MSVNVTGSISEGTCDLSAGDVNRSVKLSSIFKGDLPPSGAAGAVNFNLTVGNCAAGLSNATFTFSGTPDPNDGLRYMNTGNATGVAIELASSSDGQTIGANGTNNSRTVAISGGQAVLGLTASYWRIGTVPIKAGSVSAVATVNTSYN
ncbi:MAG: fimbrial protein [Rhodanobacter sp.]